MNQETSLDSLYAGFVDIKTKASRYKKEAYQLAQQAYSNNDMDCYWKSLKAFLTFEEIENMARCNNV